MKRLVVGISGASCANLAVKFLVEMQAHADWETHLIISEGGRRTLAHETRFTPAEVEALATRSYPIDDIGASIASGSFQTEGMVIIPCSMKTLAGIAHGYSDNLLLRAADVVLKEKRKLVLVARETPLSLIHLRNMVELATMGVILLPPMLTCYHRPQTVDELETHIVGKVMTQFGMTSDGFKCWEA